MLVSESSTASEEDGFFSFCSLAADFFLSISVRFGECLASKDASSSFSSSSASSSLLEDEEELEEEVSESCELFADTGSWLSTAVLKGSQPSETEVLTLSPGSSATRVANFSGVSPGPKMERPKSDTGLGKGIGGVKGTFKV